MIKFYCFGEVHKAVIGLTRDLRVQWALEETGLPYEVVGMKHSAGELDSKSYGHVSYFHQIPAIDDEGHIMAESGAIVLYLAEKSKKLIPSDMLGRSTVTQWCFAALTTVELPLAEILMLDFSTKDSEQPDRRAFLNQWANRVLKNLDRRLAESPWFAGPDFTVADILLATVLREIRKMDLMGPYPHVRAYYKKVFDRPAWKRALEVYAKRLGAKAEDLE